jgi:hypothetical protein
MTYVSFQLFSQEKSCKIAKSLNYDEKYSSTILNEKWCDCWTCQTIFEVKNESITCPNFFYTLDVATRLWVKCEGESHTPKSGNLESSRTPENSEDDLKGQISSHWCAPGVIGKVLKCRCPKWPRIGHLDICSSSYGQKKGRELNWQFDSRPLKVRNRPVPDVRSRIATWRWKALFKGYKFSSDLVPIGGRGEEL